MILLIFYMRRVSKTKTKREVQALESLLINYLNFFLVVTILAVSVIYILYTPTHYDLMRTEATTIKHVMRVITLTTISSSLIIFYISALKMMAKKRAKRRIEYFKRYELKYAKQQFSKLYENSEVIYEDEELKMIFPSAVNQ